MIGHPSLYCASLGTGLMGAPMLRRLQVAGYTVTACNRAAEKGKALVDDGAIVASLPAKAVAGGEADVIDQIKDGMVPLGRLTNVGPAGPGKSANRPTSRSSPSPSWPSSRRRSCSRPAVATAPNFAMRPAAAMPKAAFWICTAAE